MSAAYPHIIVKADPDELARWLATESGFIEGVCLIDDQPLRLEPYQRNFIEYMRPDGRRPRERIANKSRQVGFSFLMGVESLARAHLNPGHRSVFISYNLADAKEKIHTARMVYEQMPRAYQMRLVVDSKTELAFEDATGRNRSRIISMPAKAPRGQSKADIYLDELAHCPNDREIYIGATAVTSRGSGRQLTIASTPLGQRGIFWEIYREQVKAYPGFQRFCIPWWFCEAFCVDVPLAAVVAPSMPTVERVERFGTEGLRSQFEALPLQDFRQEFEADFVDEAVSFLTYDTILPCCDPELTIATVPAEVDTSAIKGRLVGGVDIGVTVDKTVITLFDMVGEGRTASYRIVGRFTMDGIPLHHQMHTHREILSSLPIERYRVDMGGIGRQTAVQLEEEFGRDVVEPVHFTNDIKRRMAIGLKLLLEQRRIELDREREVINDLHSIQKRTTASNNVVFVCERTGAERKKEGHADIFWSIALAVDEEPPKSTGGVVGVRMIGGGSGRR